MVFLHYLLSTMNVTIKTVKGVTATAKNLVVIIALLVLWGLILPKKSIKTTSDIQEATIDGVHVKIFGNDLYLWKGHDTAVIPRSVAEVVYLDVVFNKTSPFLGQYGIIINTKNVVRIENLDLNLSKRSNLELFGRSLGVTLP